MPNSKKNLHDEDNEFLDEQEENGHSDHTFRKEYSQLKVAETSTDIKTAIKHLPKHYFQNIATHTNICLENTRSGMRTIVGQIKRVRRDKAKVAKVANTTNKAVVVILILLGLAIIGAIAFFIADSLMKSYNPPMPAETQTQSQSPAADPTPAAETPKPTPQEEPAQ